MRLGARWRLLFFFLTSLGAAYFFGWNNTDLIWSFWTTSLIVGNVALLRALVGPVHWLMNKTTAAEWTELRTAPLSRKLGGLVLALFLAAHHLALVAFLVLHFSVFHMGHAWVLQGLFPHPALVQAADGWSDTPMLDAARILLMSYWLVVFQKLLFDHMEAKTMEDVEPSLGEAVKRPYLQVVRIHLLIFVVVGLDALEAPRGLTYGVLFTIFFFPLEVFRATEAVGPPAADTVRMPPR